MNKETEMRVGTGWVIVLLVVALASGCATTANIDPYEPQNRRVMGFNDGADGISLKPLAKGYVKVTPPAGRNSVHNFFANLRYPNVVINQFLQGKVKKGASDTGRFLINTTVGIGGLFDVAKRLGLVEHHEDFGQTLAVWGVASGPYLMVPFWGPVTVRDAVGDLLDTLTYPTFYIKDVALRNGLIAGWALDRRAAVLDAESLISGDRYLFVRDAVLQHREYLILDGEVTDPFLEEYE